MLKELIPKSASEGIHSKIGCEGLIPKPDAEGTRSKTGF
jgi:hypothetical protein